MAVDSAGTGSDQAALSRLADRLLELDALGARRAAVADSGYLSADGLGQLVRTARKRIGSDPEQAARLAAVLAEVAEAAVPEALPRAQHVQAQAVAFMGDLRGAEALLELARSGYVEQGDARAARRTDLGRMHLLMGQGRASEAAALGDDVLAALEADDGHSDDVRRLRGLTRQNRGLAHYYLGNSSDALDDLNQALSLVDGDDALSADVRLNRALVEVGMGRAVEGLRDLEAAAESYARLGMSHAQAQALTNLGDAHLAAGNYRESVQALDQARRAFAEVGSGNLPPTLTIDSANAYLALNLYPEAAESYRNTLDQLSDSGAELERGRALRGLGAALSALGDYEPAERHLTEAASAFQQTGNPGLVSSVLAEHAALQAARGETDDARATAKQALDLVDGSRFPVQRAESCLRMVDLLMPDADGAESYLTEAQQLGESLGLPQLRFRVNQRLGEACLVRGQSPQAEAYLNEAVDQIERTRGTLAEESLRSSFLRDKTRAYESLVGLYMERGDKLSLDRAFSVAERSKSRSLVDMIMGLVDTRIDRLDDPERVQGLQALRQDLDAIYNQWLDSGGTEQRAVAVADLRTRAVEIERRINRLKLEAARPETAPSMTVAMTPEAIRRHLEPGVALLAYHIIDDEIVAFVATRDRIRSARGLGSLSAIRRDTRQLHDQWQRFRAGSRFVSQHKDQLERTTLRILNRLYDQLIRPLEPALTAVASGAGPMELVIVPHGPLHQVPFHALHDGRNFLIDRAVCSYAPSATVFSLCSNRSHAIGGESLVMAVADDAIPFARQEAAAVADVLSTEALLDEDAALPRFLEHAPGSDVIHLACHGLFRSDNPMFSALRLADGWLTAEDVMDRSFDGALITLSACESGRSEVIGGDELIGLTRAFLGAGATSVVVSQWLAQDEPTAALMAGFYRQMGEGVGRAEALRAAQLAVREQQSHPYYWAPFVLVGKR